MKKLSAGLIALGFLMGVAIPALADIKEEVEKLVKAIKEGKGYRPIRIHRYPQENQQYFSFYGGGMIYIIDVKARLCFGAREGKALIPCEALKKGYPLIAPLITWVK